VKISAFSVYRFFRNGLPAMTKAALICVVLAGVLAVFVFSPEISFEKKNVPETLGSIATVSVSKTYTEVAEFQDFEPLFFPTHWNFGAETLPSESHARYEVFLPFGATLIGQSSVSSALRLKETQAIPSAENALGADAWEIARGFGRAPLDSLVPADVSPTKTAVRIENLDTNEIVFAGTLDDVNGDVQQTLPSPAELFCGLASEYGRPRVVVVHSCGDADLDAKIEKASASLLDSLNLERGFYRIIVEPR